MSENKKKEYIYVCNNCTGAIKFAKHALRMNDKTLTLKNVSYIISRIIGNGINMVTKVIVIADTCFREGAQFTVHVNKTDYNLLYNTKTKKFDYNDKQFTLSKSGFGTVFLKEKNPRKPVKSA